MASSKPVVATKVGGVPEIVVEGETGFLVKPKDTNALANQIINLLQDPDKRKEMGENGRKRVKENFSLAQHVTQVRNLYARLWKHQDMDSGSSPE